jgi:hypothetical protein
VVGGDAVEGAIGHALPHGVPVRGSPERRVHLGLRPVAIDGLVRKGEVVRGRLRGDAHALGAGRADHLYPETGGNVLDVDVSAGQPGQHQVPCDGHVLGRVGDAREAEARREQPLVHGAAAGECPLLAVAGDGDAEVLRVLQREAHEPRVRDRIAVVADSHRTGRDHLAHLRQPLHGVPVLRVTILIDIW